MKFKPKSPIRHWIGAGRRVVSTYGKQDWIEKNVSPLISITKIIETLCIESINRYPVIRIHLLRVNNKRKETA